MLEAIRIVVSGSAVERMETVCGINSNNTMDNFVKEDETCS